MALDCDCDEYLTVNSVDLQSPAWLITDLADLERLQKRGRDRIIPGSAGFVSNPRRLAGLTMLFPLVVVGDVDRLGNLVADVREGLRDNIDYLRANVAQVASASTTAVTATWHQAGGTTLTAQVHVESLEFSQFGEAIREGVLELAVPAGRFT